MADNRKIPAPVARDDAPSGGEAVDTRQTGVAAREAAARDRENALSEREGAAVLREEAVRVREETARALAEHDPLVDRLRDANEHLVLANVRAQTLAEKAEHLAAIVESTDDAIYGNTLDGVITSWNRGAERIYGYTAAEVIGAPVTVLVPADQADELPAMLERLGRGEMMERSETVRVRKDGTRIDVALTTSPIRDEAGRVVAASTIARDVTEHRQIERERADLFRREHEARAEAERANRLKDEFLAMVSHELRTPLNAVLGWARMITSHQVEGERVAHGLEVIERGAAALALLIDDLLDVSRIVAGSLELESEPVDLLAVTSAACDAVGPAASANRIDLQVLADPNAIDVVNGDSRRLQQVIGNLLTNAIKFTPAGGRVDVSIARVDAGMQVSVTDTGQGIEPAFLPHVFERFRQGDASTTRKHGGLGLGLAIVRELVELHGGSVHAASRGRGHGATFTVLLPVPTGDAIGKSGSSMAGSPDAPARPRAERLDGVRVLVVDDDVVGRTLTALLLTRCGASVSSAASARDGLRALLAESPDVLVIDIGLPDEDGYALLRRVRQEQAAQNRFTPAIALTGYENRRAVLAAGFQEHLVKPCDAATLIPVVAAFARGSQQG